MFKDENILSSTYKEIHYTGTFNGKHNLRFRSPRKAAVLRGITCPLKKLFCIGNILFESVAKGLMQNVLYIWTCK